MPKIRVIISVRERAELGIGAITNVFETVCMSALSQVFNRSDIRTEDGLVLSFLERNVDGALEELSSLIEGNESSLD
jgi:hypothetical protein